MGLETGTHISDLVAANPVGATDPKSQGDDHLQLIKTVLKTDFPNVNGAVNPTPTEFNRLVGLTAAIVQVGGAFHDGFSDFVADEHVAHASVSLIGGNGISSSGLGTIAASRTINLDAAHSRNADHNAIDVIAGNGLIGGGFINQNRTFDVVGGIGITANANDIAHTAHTGDVTGAAALSIAANAVVTAKILNSNVTYAKIQNVSATNLILGRDTAGAGVIEEITPAALRTMLGVHQIHTGDVTGNEALTIAANAVVTAKLLNANVTYAKIQNVAANNVLLGNDNGVGQTVQELTAAAVRTLLNVVSGASVSSVGSGVAITGGPITGSGTLNFDFSGLTNRTVADTAPTDSHVFNNSGVMEQIDIQDEGIRVVNLSTIQTFARGDANTHQRLTGATLRVWTIPTNAAVAFPIGIIILTSAQDAGAITFGVAGITLDHPDGHGGIRAGGAGAIKKTGTNRWSLVGQTE